MALTIQVRPATSAPSAWLIGPMAATGALNETSASMVPSAATVRVERGVGRMERPLGIGVANATRLVW